MFSQKAKRRFNRHVYPLFRERFTLAFDYENWLRDDLRNWAEAILFDNRMMDRGIFNPDFIRSIWAQHQSGQKQWTLGKVAPIMTYEMMLQELVDVQQRRSMPHHAGLGRILERSSQLHG